MKLYGSFTSPYVRHCRIVVKQTASDCNFIETTFSNSQSPTMRVPYFEDGAIKLTDSNAIVKYLRERADQDFTRDIHDYNLLCMANTLLDTTVNLFLLEQDKLTTSQSAYLSRQQQRVESCLIDLNSGSSLQQPIDPLADGQLRLACYLEWAQLRRRIDLQIYPNLQRFLDSAKTNSEFEETLPPI